MFKRILWGALVALCLASPAFGQSSVLPYYYNSSNVKTPIGTNSPMPTIAGAPSDMAVASTAALAANLVVKASAGRLWSFEVSADSTLSGAAWWIMIYNATSAPSDGAITPAKCYAMASGTTSYAAAFPQPIPLGTGITIGVSTNGCFTKAASTHAFISADYQ